MPRIHASSPSVASGFSSAKAAALLRGSAEAVRARLEEAWSRDRQGTHELLQALVLRDAQRLVRPARPTFTWSHPLASLLKAVAWHQDRPEEIVTRYHQLLALAVLGERGDEQDALWLRSILANRVERQIHHAGGYVGPSYHEVPTDEWTETEVTYPRAGTAGLNHTLGSRRPDAGPDEELHRAFDLAAAKLEQRHPRRGSS